MPSAVRRLVTLAALLLVALPAAAQPADPLELVRGLREAGWADLALEYLAELPAKHPGPGVLAVLPLERARTNLDLAAAEGDPARRAALVAEAKADFDRFLASSATHPRRGEAALALARLVAVQAKGILAGANNQPDAAGRDAELRRAGPVFEDAAKRFQSAAAAFAQSRDDGGLTAAEKRQADADVFQARLDEADNQFQLAQTYPREGTDNVPARMKALDTARVLFDALAKQDPSQPLCWVARAWVGECDRAKGNAKEAQVTFDAVKAAAAKNPAAAAGARTARFFEAKAEYEKALSATADRGNALRRAQAGLEQWLADAGKAGRPTPETFAARYYIAYAKDQQARALVRLDPKTMQPVVPDAARDLFRAAERDYRRAADPANDYTTRAGENRSQVIRLLVGDPDRADPATMTDYDLVLMTAQVQLARAARADDTAARRGPGSKAARLFERLGELPSPPGGTRDAADAAVGRVYALLLADRPFEAAVLGDHLAHTLRAPAAGRAGVYAVQAYRQAGEDADAAARAADLGRAADVARYLDGTYPNDPNTDAVRIGVAQQFVQAGRAKEGFDLAGRVPATSPRAASARLVQAAAVSALPAGERGPAARRTAADLLAVPAAPPSAIAADARASLGVGVQVAEMDLLTDPPDLAAAEKAAAAVLSRVAAYKELPPDDIKEWGLRADFVRLRAVYGQALTQFQAGKFADAAGRLAAELAAVAGPAAGGTDPATPLGAAAKRVDDFRRDRLVGLALQARIREGKVDQIGPLLEALQRLGGSLAGSAGTLGPLVDGVRPQLAALRKAGKSAEADAIARSLGGVLDRVAAEPGVQPATLIVLGRGIRDLGDPDRAAGYLLKVPLPANMELLKQPPTAVPPADAPTVALYRLAQLELARCLRQAKKFGEADALLAGALGWVPNADFRREVAHLAEARAADAAPADASKLWAEAYKKWTAMANEYLAPLRKLAAGKRDARSAVLVLADLKALPPHPLLPPKPEDIRRGLTDPKPPAWVGGLLADKAYADDLQATIGRLEGQLKPLYHDLFAESLRCLTAANTSLLQASPDKLTAALDRVGKSAADFEAANPDLADAVRAKMAAVLADSAPLRDAYLKAGGKAFVPPDK